MHMLLTIYILYNNNDYLSFITSGQYQLSNSMIKLNIYVKTIKFVIWIWSSPSQIMSLIKANIYTHHYLVSHQPPTLLEKNVRISRAGRLHRRAHLSVWLDLVGRCIPHHHLVANTLFAWLWRVGWWWLICCFSIDRSIVGNNIASRAGIGMHSIQQ
jgi:hypothetical protein